MDSIKCPLLNKEIKDIICFDICMVAEGMAPLSTAPDEVTNVRDFRKKCLNCEYHKE